MIWISTLLRDKALRFCLGLFLIARVSLTIWSVLAAFLLPIQVQNLDLYGAPVLATFDIRTSERHTFSRRVNGSTLSFRPGEPGAVVDTQTSSVWSLADGRALSGPLVGSALGVSLYSVEEVFPYHGVAVENDPVVALWQRFDSNWYLAIAQRGYSSDDGTTVYFPVYPLLIHLAGGSFLAALLISNTALVGALYVLYRLTETLADATIARRALVYLLLFPSGFFLFAAYTESLFLFFSVGAFLFAIRDRWYLAALFGVLAALTRLQGVLLLVPLAFMLYRRMGALDRSDPSRVARYLVRGMALLLIPLATLAFLVLTNFSLLSGYVGQLHAQFVLPWDNLAASVARLSSGQAGLIDALNLLMTVVFGVLLIPVWRKLPHEYGLFALLMFLAPLFRMTTSQPLVSMLRYVLALFPVFWVLGSWGRNPWVNRLIVYSSVPLQLFLTAQFVWWGWVG